MSPVCLRYKLLKAAICADNLLSSIRSYLSFNAWCRQAIRKMETPRMQARRLNKEYCDCLKQPSEGISAGPRLGHNIYPYWDAYIHGPENSPYEGSIFKLQIVFPDSYPFKPPKVTFVTKILHCNIDHNGHTHLDILHLQWSPTFTAQKVLLSIRCLLQYPNADDPLNVELAALLRKNRTEHDRVVREATLKHAIRQVDSESDDDS